MKSHLSIFLMLVSLILGVKLQAQPPAALSNSSVLMQLAPGATGTLGFVVSQQSPQPLTVLYRAVGPSLSAFGITNTVSAPHVRLFNSQSQNISRIAFITPPSWTSLFNIAGAFPLTGGETAITAYNANLVTPGAYTVQATDDSGKGGNILVEVYIVNGNLAGT